MDYIEYIQHNYSACVELFRPHCRYPRLMNTLAHGINSYNISVLEDFLKSINYQVQETASTHSAPEEISPSIIVPPVSPVEPGIFIPSEEIIKGFKERMRPHFQLRSYHHTQLEVVKTDEERYQLAKEIMRLTRLINEIEAEEDYYRQNGQLKPAPPVQEFEGAIKCDVNDPVALYRRWDTVRKNLSRDKNKPHKLPRWKEELDAIEALEQFKSFKK